MDDKDISSRSEGESTKPVDEDQSPRDSQDERHEDYEDKLRSWFDLVIDELTEAHHQLHYPSYHALDDGQMEFVDVANELGTDPQTEITEETARERFVHRDPVGVVFSDGETLVKATKLVLWHRIHQPHLDSWGFRDLQDILGEDVGLLGLPQVKLVHFLGQEVLPARSLLLEMPIYEFVRRDVDGLFSR